MTDLTTSYLGLTLDNPVVASASPLTGELESLHRLEAAGAAAVVLPSLFEEQIDHDARWLDQSLDAGAEMNAEALGGFFPGSEQWYRTTIDDHLDLVTAAVDALSIPVIASLNGTSPGGWTTYASALADRGAAALELNIYRLVTDPATTGAEVEEHYLRLVEQVKAAVDIPLSVKIGPWFSSPANMARRLTDAGADGLVLFNRFYQPDIDLDALDIAPNLVLSSPEEIRLALRWIAILRGRIEADLAATSGVHDGEGVVKLILAGANVAMMTSALLRHGPELITTVVNDVDRWFTERDYRSLDQGRGSMSLEAIGDPDRIVRANYLTTLASYAPPV